MAECTTGRDHHNITFNLRDSRRKLQKSSSRQSLWNIGQVNEDSFADILSRGVETIEEGGFEALIAGIMELVAMPQTQTRCGKLAAY